MATASTFDSTKTPLNDLLTNVGSGKMQLPDFQRNWVWDDNHIKSLLASVSVAFPIGAVMTLETGGEGVRFKPRLVEGTDGDATIGEPEILILDGQQRLTSLFQSLKSGNVVDTRDSRGKKIKRWYYIKIDEALRDATDREEAIVSVPEDKIARRFGGEIELDLSDREREYELGYFPATALFNAASWRREYNGYWDYDKAKIELFDEFEAAVIKLFEQYQVPVIELSKETPKEAVCLVFEKVNTGGVSLTVFELVTASFAADNFQLRDDWRDREKRLKGQHPVLRNLQSDDLLQCICLLVTQRRRAEAVSSGVASDKAPGISCKRRDILKLSVEEYKTWAEEVTVGFERAARFLHEQKIFNARDLPYRTQLVPLAAILTALGKDADTDSARRRLAQWFWCGVLGELYGSATESRFAKDLPEMVEFVRNGVEPSTIHDANFSPNRLLTLRTRNSAAYKGLYALLMRDGGLDFRTGERIEAQSFFDDSIDIHHIFPKKWCEQKGIEASSYNSVINKTALSATTNRTVGGNAPSVYLDRLQRQAGIEAGRMDEILETHLIDPASLRGDKYETFFERRATKLLDRIEKAIGKSIAREEGMFTDTAQTDEFVDDVDEWDDEGGVLTSV